MCKTHYNEHKPKPDLGAVQEFMDRIHIWALFKNKNTNFKKPVDVKDIEAIWHCFPMVYENLKKYGFSTQYDIDYEWFFPTDDDHYYNFMDVNPGVKVYFGEIDFGNVESIQSITDRLEIPINRLTYKIKKNILYISESTDSII